MPGNEIDVVTYLVQNIGTLTLNHLGRVETIQMPSGSGLVPITKVADMAAFYSDDSHKKADVYINGQGISIKQTGASFPFNRLQRADLFDLFNLLGLTPAERYLRSLDNAVIQFHEGTIEGRSRPWSDFFSLDAFSILLKYLMLEGSPNLGPSAYKAAYILEAPGVINNAVDLKVLTFDEYLRAYAGHLYIALRRQWVGQMSNSEHNRACSIARKPGNAPWVFDTISGQPREQTGQIWRPDVPEEGRRTVYMLFLEKI